MTDLDWARAYQLVGSPYAAERLVDVSALACAICGAFIRDGGQMGHAEWHVKNGDVNV